MYRVLSADDVIHALQALLQLQTVFSRLDALEQQQRQQQQSVTTRLDALEQQQQQGDSKGAAADTTAAELSELRRLTGSIAQSMSGLQAGLLGAAGTGSVMVLSNRWPEAQHPQQQGPQGPLQAHWPPLGSSMSSAPLLATDGSMRAGPVVGAGPETSSHIAATPVAVDVTHQTEGRQSAPVYQSAPVGGGSSLRHSGQDVKAGVRHQPNGDMCDSKHSQQQSRVAHGRPMAQQAVVGFRCQQRCSEELPGAGHGLHQLPPLQLPPRIQQDQRQQQVRGSGVLLPHVSGFQGRAVQQLHLQTRTKVPQTDKE